MINECKVGSEGLKTAAQTQQYNEKPMAVIVNFGPKNKFQVLVTLIHSFRINIRRSVCLEPLRPFIDRRQSAFCLEFEGNIISTRGSVVKLKPSFLDSSTSSDSVNGLEAGSLIISKKEGGFRDLAQCPIFGWCWCSSIRRAYKTLTVNRFAFISRSTGISPCVDR